MISSAIINGMKSALRIKLRVQGNDFVRPFDDGGHVPARAVIAGTQVKVVEPVVVAPAIEMVDGLLGPEGPAKGLLHDVSVLQDLAARFPRDRNANPHISLRGHGTVDFPDRVAGVEHGGLRLALALRAAITDGAIQLSIWPTTRGEFLAAGDARRIPSFFAVGFPAHRRARDRAVERVSSKRFPVLTQFARLSVERLAAVFAHELDGLDRARPPVFGFVSAVAVVTAEFSRTLARLGLEGFAALLAGVRNWHRLLRDKCDTYQYEAPVWSSSAINTGAA